MRRLNELSKDDMEFGDNFHNLKPTNFFNLQQNLSRSENLVIIMNAEYAVSSLTAAQQIAGQQQQPQQQASALLSASVSSTSNNKVPVPNYNRMPSFTSGTNPGRDG